MAKLIIFLSFICAVYLKVELANTFTCDKYEDCSQGKPGYQVPDPYNCSQYYVCITSSSGTVPNETPTPCPTGEYFDCGKISCQPETIPGVCVQDCWKGITNSACSLQCTNTLDIVPYPGDCSKFYYCTASNPIPSNCTDSNPYFNGTTCVSDVRKCCNTCVPYCFKTGSLVADPYDCTKYYICQVDGTVQERHHQTCIQGKYFDPQVGECVPGTSCSSFCSDSPIITTSTTITSTTPTSRIVTSTPPVCPNTYPCTMTGNFPRCNFCDISYFHCAGSTATIENCGNGMVFNTNPAYPYCISTLDCPYPN